MPIIQAAVPRNNLATAMGAPNRISVEYSTDVLLPVAGPALIAVMLKQSVHALMDLNEVMILVDDAREFLAAGGRFAFQLDDPKTVIPRPRAEARQGRPLINGARELLNKLTAGRFLASVPQFRFGAREARVPRQDSLLRRLATPNPVLRDLFDASLFQRTQGLFAPALTQAGTFAQRVAVILEALLALHADRRPGQVTDVMRQLSTQATEIASRRYGLFRSIEFRQLPENIQSSLALWLATNYLQKGLPLANEFQPDLIPLLGFTPIHPAREWSLNRFERLDLDFGVPDIRGPLATDAIPPQGRVEREDYSSSSLELARLTAQTSTTDTQEALTISTAVLRRALSSVYYSGTGDVNQLTGQASNALLTEQRRGTVLAIIREYSESREQSEAAMTSRTSSSTTTVRAPGVDPRLAATHHRFKVVLPVVATAVMYDVGLTWCPRISNPFLELRTAIRRAYRDARDSHMLQFYVPEPLSPPLTYETYTVSDMVYLDNDGDGSVSEYVTLYVTVTDRNDHPDFVNASAEFSQDRGTWRNDSDEWTASFDILSYSGGAIRVRVRVDVEDDHWQGYVTVTIPVLRYDDATVNALAQFRIQMRDYEYQRDALSAQAAQYAAIKQREFIERHERLTVLNRIVYDALMKRVCAPLLAPDVSYYKEIVTRCIDWTRAKIEFEPGHMNDLEYSDYPADHFVNSRAVRFFLPVVRTAEAVFFDALTACGTFAVRASVVNARNAIDAARVRIAGAPNGVEQLDQFNTEIVLGEHIEAVMSNHDHAR